MKFVRFRNFTAGIFFVAMIVTVRAVAQESPTASPHSPRYNLVDLGTFGGPQSFVNIPPFSYAQVLNNSGTVTGWADTPLADPFPDVCFTEDCFVAHAFRGAQSGKHDIGVLPGGSSSQGNWISENGLIAGTSENGELDPLIPGFPELRAVLWKHDKIIDLGTLDGGYESGASAVNSRGQVVGFATNTIPDPDSMVGVGFQTRAFLWQNGVMKDLGTLGTGTDAIALLVNERGQVAGDSYISSAPSDACDQAEVGTLTTGAFLWTNGKMVDLGNFGGTCTFAFDLNNRGQVVGGSRLAGDQEQHPFLWNGRKLVDLGTFGGGLGNAIALNDAGDVTGFATYPGDEIVHAALWSHEKASDLGTLGGDASSIGFDIDERGEVIGISTNDFLDLSQYRAFLWQPGGPMLDLNDLVSGSSLQLVLPATINDQGEIAGIGLDPEGNQHAFLLVPCGDGQLGTEGCRDLGLAAIGRANTTPKRPVSKNSAALGQRLLMSRPLVGARGPLRGLHSAIGRQ